MFVLIYIVVTFNHAGDHDLSILYTLQAINITLIIFMNYIPKNKEYICSKSEKGVMFLEKIQKNDLKDRKKN